MVKYYGVIFGTKDPGFRNKSENRQVEHGESNSEIKR